METLIIAGTVGKDAVLRRTGNNDAVLGFSVAVDQGKDKNDRLSVDGIEIQWLFKPQEHARNLVQPMQTRMRQGDTLAHAGRPQAFAFL